MSGFTSFAAAAGANQNLDNSYETIGYDTNGVGTLVSANGSAHTKGAYASAQLSAATANAWAGFYLMIGTGSASTSRQIMDISFDGGSTTHVPNLYYEPNSNNGLIMVWIPLAVAAGSQVMARIQASAGSQTVRLGIIGVVRNSQSAPMYTTMTALAVDTTNTRAGTSSISMQNNAGTTYGTIVASTGAQYSAFLFSPGHSGTNPATAQNALLRFATGAAASEVEFGLAGATILNSATPFNISRQMPSYERTIASGTRLSVKPLVATPGTDTLFMAAYGFA